MRIPTSEFFFFAAFFSWSIKNRVTDILYSVCGKCGASFTRVRSFFCFFVMDVLLFDSFVCVCVDGCIEAP